jgi:hypothetical protein
MGRRQERAGGEGYVERRTCGSRPEQPARVASRRGGSEAAPSSESAEARRGGGGATERGRRGRAEHGRLLTIYVYPPCTRKGYPFPLFEMSRALCV